MHLQKSYLGMSRRLQNIHHYIPNAGRWPLRCLLIMLLGYFFVQFRPLLIHSAAQTQYPPLVTQEIRYYMPEAGEVFLVWGIDGWQVVPEEIHPAGTVINNELMHTSMEREGDTFLVKVQVTAGATLDYGFLITKEQNGATIEPLWDGDYQTNATQNGIVEIEATVTLPQDETPGVLAETPLMTQEIRYHLPEAGKVFFVWGIDGWGVVPEDVRPAGTVLKNEVMHTPMERQGDTFVTKVQVTAGATIDYGFLTTMNRQGATIKVWEVNGDQSFHTKAEQGGVIEVNAQAAIPRGLPLTNAITAELQQHSFLILLIGVGIICSIGIISIKSGGIQKKQKLLLVFLGVLIVVALLPNSPFYIKMPTRDAGVFLYASQQILKGNVPYGDVWDHKPPGIYYVDALGLVIGRGSIWGVWFLEFLAIYIALVLAFKLVKQAFGTLPAVFAVTSCSFWLISILEWEYFITEEFGLPFQCAALYLFYQAEQKGIYAWRGFLIGVSLIIAFIFKPNLIGIQGSIMLLLAFGPLRRDWHTSLKNLLSIVLGALGTIIIVITYLFSQDIFTLFLDQAFNYNFSLYSDLSLLTRLNAIYDGLKNNVILTIVVLIAWFLAIFYAWRKTDWTKEKRYLLYLLIVGLPLELLLVSASGRSYGHYYIAWLPIFAILSGLFAYALTKEKLLGSANIANICLALTLIAIIFNPAQRFRQRLVPDLIYEDGRNAIINYIENTTTKDDYVLLWGAESSINFITGRPSPTRFVYQYPLYTRNYQTPGMIEEFLNDILTNQPALIIDTSSHNKIVPPLDLVKKQAWKPSIQYDVLPEMDRVYNYIHASYEFVGKVGEVQWSVYKYVGDTSTTPRQESKNAQTTAQPRLVTQEIRYHMPEAGEVLLVWGIDGWQVVPEEIRPAGTMINNEVMHTPMEREGDTFVIKVQATVGATLDYGFLITKEQNGVNIEPLWDGDYQTNATQNGIVEMEATVTLSQHQTPTDYVPPLSFDFELPWIALVITGFSLILGVLAYRADLIRLQTLWLIIILLVGMNLRLNHISQPFTDYINWRQGSVAMMADNFYRTNWNIFYPEVSWNGPGPSYQGREFQTVSYISALLYVVFGQHDWIGRVVAVVFGLWGIFALYQLVRRVWDEERALAAAVVMAVLPGAIFIERSFLPDPAMVALVVTSFWMLLAYLQTERLHYLILAGLIGMWGLLTKIPGLIIGLPMVYAILAIWGYQRLRNLKRLITLGLAACLVLIPVVAYYLWVRHLALTYPPYHFAGAENWLWDHGIEAWLAENYFISPLYWDFRQFLWTEPMIILVLISLFLRPPELTSQKIVPKRFLAIKDWTLTSFRANPGKAPWLFHFWFLAGVIYYFIGAKELVVNAWNFHLLNPAAAAFAGHALVTIVSLTRQRIRRPILLAALTAILLIFIGFGQYKLAAMYYPQKPWDATESYKMGLALRQAAQPGDLVVTIPNDIGSPVAIYYSQQRGWVFPQAEAKLDWTQLPKDDNQAIRLFEELRSKGADWFGIVNEHRNVLWKNYPVFVEHLNQYGEFHSETSDYIIYRLLNPEDVAILTPEQGSLSISEVRLSLLIGLGIVFAIGIVFTIRRGFTMISFIASRHSWQLIYLRDLLYEMVVRDMKLRYKRSVLGIAWSLLNPLAQLLVFYFIFSLVLPLNIPNYALFVFIGLTTWTWFQSSLFQATGAIVDNPDLIRRPGFPPAVLPIVTVITHLIHFLLALPILLIFLLLGHSPISTALLGLPFLVVLQFLFTLSLSYGVATLHVIFRDTQYLLGILLTLAFYLTPIFYDPGFVPERFRGLYNLNPMVHLVDAYRAILLRGESPALWPLLLIGLSSAFILYFSYTIFTRASYRFVEEL